MALRHRIQDLIEDGTISTPAGPNVGTKPLPNHPPAAGINALITDDEGPDPFHFITDASGPQSPSGRHITTLSYKCTWGYSDQDRDFFRKDSDEDSKENSSEDSGEESVKRECERKIGVMPLKTPGEINRVTPVYNPLMSQWMAKMNLVPGQGLRKTNQGMTSPLLLTTNPGKTGL